VQNDAIELLPAGEERPFILSNHPTTSWSPTPSSWRRALRQLTYIRLYQGHVQKGADIVNTRTGKKVKVGRLGRMHAALMEDIEQAEAGDIVALFGVECASGDTFTGGKQISLTSMHVPEPSCPCRGAWRRQGPGQAGEGIAPLHPRDPTFRTAVDPETGDTLIRGMGELHLEVYVERIRASSAPRS